MREIERARARAALPMVPAMGVDRVLERRRAAMRGDHVRAGPGAGDGVREGRVGRRRALAQPGAQHVADLVHHGSEQRGLARLPDMVVHEADGAGMRLPPVARPDDAGAAPADRVSGPGDPGDVYGEAGAGLAARPDAEFPPGGAVVSDQPALRIARVPRPCLPRVGDPPAPDLAGPFERRRERPVAAHRGRRVGQVEVDRQRVRRTARPAPVAHAAAPAQRGDAVVVPQAGAEPRVPPPGGGDPVAQAGDAAGGVGQRRQALREQAVAAMAPVVEKIVRGGVVQGAQRNPPPARRGGRSPARAGGRGGGRDTRNRAAGLRNAGGRRGAGRRPRSLRRGGRRRRPVGRGEGRSARPGPIRAETGCDQQCRGDRRYGDLPVHAKPPVLRETRRRKSCGAWTNCDPLRG